MRRASFDFDCDLRPIVRYVDAEQAIVEVTVELREKLNLQTPFVSPEAIRLDIEIAGSDGFFDEEQLQIDLEDGRGSTSVQIVKPKRWWPAGMGDQTLYDISVTAKHKGRQIASRISTVGLTSVRSENGKDKSLLVNGEHCEIESVFTVDHIHEQRMLPVAGNSLLVVRDHYGTDLLYNAADRAGILMLQCVPIHPDAMPQRDIARQVDRLIQHPSLAGWYIGHLGDMSDDIARALHQLDPTHAIFKDLPDTEAG